MVELNDAESDHGKRIYKPREKGWAEMRDFK